MKMERIDLKLDKIDKIFDKNFVKINERFNRLEERIDDHKKVVSSDNNLKFSSNIAKFQIVDVDEPEDGLKDSNFQNNSFNGSMIDFNSYSLISDDMETETKNFLIEESSRKINFPRLSDINEEGLGKFTFSKVLSKCPATILMSISDSKCWGNYAALNQWLLVNSTGIPADSYILPNLFAYWSEENLTDSIGQGGFFLKIPISFLFEAITLRITRFTDFLYFYTMYWDPLL